MKLKYIFKEVTIKPNPRIWDFTKYIPNFDPKKIKIGDTIKQQFRNFEPYLYKINNIKISEDGDIYFKIDGDEFGKIWLNSLQNKNEKNKQKEISNDFI